MMKTLSSYMNNISFAGAFLIVNFATIVFINLLANSKVSAGILFPYDGQGHSALSSSVSDNAGRTGGGGWGAGDPGFGNGAYNCESVDNNPNNVWVGGQAPGACNTGFEARNNTFKLFSPNGKPNVDSTLRLINGCRQLDSNWLVSPYGTSKNEYAYKKTGSESTTQPYKGSRMMHVGIHKTAANGGTGSIVSDTSNGIDASSTYRFFGYGGDVGETVLPSSACQGNDMIVNVSKEAFTSQSKYFGGNMYTATVVVNKTGGYLGEQWFKLLYTGIPGGEVYGDDVSYFGVGRSIEDTSGNFNNPNYYNSNYNFSFQPSCDYNGETVQVKVSDFDPNNTAQQILTALNKKITLRVYDTSGGLNEVRSYKVNETPPSHTFNIAGLNKDHTYVFELQNIADNNGIKVNLPFSEYKRTAACPSQVQCSISIQKLGRSTTIPDQDGVEAGQPFQVTVYMTNKGSSNFPTFFGTNFLSATLDRNDGSGNWAWPPPNGEGYNTSGSLAAMRVTNSYGPYWSGTNVAYNNNYIPAGGTYQASMTFTAPLDQGSHLIRMFPDFWRLGPVGGTPNYCDQTVNSYQRYDFTAKAGTKLLPTSESPNQVEFTPEISQQGVNVVGTTTRYVKKNGAANVIGPRYETRNGVNGNFFGIAKYPENYDIPVNTYKLGDYWCGYLSLDYGHGWKGPLGQLNERPEVADNCADPGGTERVPNKPYVRTYGADTIAGGGFENSSCGNTPNSRILSFLMPLAQQVPLSTVPGRGSTTGKSGSGSELASMAPGDIRGFRSVSLRNLAPNSPRGLTFGNTNFSDNGQDSPLIGGSLKSGANDWCVPDYFNTTQFEESDTTRKNTSSSTGDINIGTLPTGAQTLRNVNGAKVAITNSTPQLSGANKHTVYIDGDAVIKNNIVYSTDYSGGIQNIPSITIIVKGNIYVDKNVTRLDGMFIAQPRVNSSGTVVPNTGRFVSCADGATGTTISVPSQIYSQCGAEIDSNTPRSSNPRVLTVNGSIIAQKLILNRVPYSIGNSVYQETAANSKAAEVINFTPELYLSPPIFTTKGDNYNYLAILAPIL